MCCSTGVCGPSVDPELARFTADLDWLKKQGVQVERYNLSQQPGAFAANAVVNEALRTRGNGVPADGRRGRARRRRRRLPVDATRSPLSPASSFASLEAAPAATSCCGPKAEGHEQERLELLLRDPREPRRPRSASLVFHGQGRRRQDVGRLRDGACPRGARSTGAPREHRPGVEPRRGPRHATRRESDARDRCGEPSGAEHRPGSRRAGLPRAHRRSLSRRAARRGRAEHRGAALGSVHGGDRGVRRVLEVARGRRSDGGVRSRRLRHGAHGTHAASSRASRRMDRVSRVEHGRHVLPRAACRSEGPAGDLRRFAARARRRRSHGAGARESAGSVGPARGGEDARRARLARRPPAGARAQRVFRGADRMRPLCRRARGAGSQGARGDARGSRRPPADGAAAHAVRARRARRRAGVARGGTHPCRMRASTRVTRLLCPLLLRCSPSSSEPDAASS